MKAPRETPRRIPIDGRYIGRFLAGFLLALSPSPDARAQERAAVDAASVTARAAAASPLVRIAEARVERARAHRVGADLWSRENPTLSVWGGPRQLTTGEWVPDLIVGFSVPFDLSGVRPAREASVEASVREAEAEAEEVRQVARDEALGVWLRVLAARDRVAALTQREQVEAALQRIAETRLRAGSTGLEDVTLATVARALAQGALAAAESEYAGALIELRGRLGVDPGEPLDPREGLVDEAPLPPLEALLARLPRRADLQRAARAVDASAAEARLQSRLGVPPLRVGIAGGRENEYYGRVGVDWALPLVQRNQTAVAVARSGVRLGEVEREALRARAAMELRAAYARYEASLRAWRLLRDALPAADQSERLAGRAYELGLRPLEGAVVVLRHTSELRLALIDAALAIAEARRAVARAVGGL